MKIEYIPESSAGPVLMISDVTTQDCTRLVDLLYGLSTRAVEAAAIHELFSDVSAPECRLTVKVGQRDIGVVRETDDSFACILKAGSWDNAAGLVEPFCRDNSGFQWLDSSSEISLLLSPHGTW